MTDLLIRLFVPNSLTERNKRQRYGTLSSVVGIVVNVLLAVLKLVIAFFTKSISIMGDGVNNLFDSISAVISLISFRVAAKPADREHPFGHARFEYISSNIVALLIAYVGIAFLRESIGKIIQPNPTSLGTIHIIILIISILVKIWLYFFYSKIARTINSDLILANAKDSLSDVLATSVVIIALVFSPLIGIELDGPLGIVISIIILKNAYDIFLETFNKIMGQAPRKEEVQALEEKILEYPGVLGVHDLIMHDYGPGRQYVSVHVEVDSEVDVIRSHELIDQVEREIEAEGQVHLTIHMDPLQLNDPSTIYMKAKVELAINEFNADYSIHDFRIVESYQTTQVLTDVLVPSNVEEDALEKIEQDLLGHLNARFKDCQFILKLERDRNA